MLFSSTFNKVMDGTKTQTRRPVKNKQNQKEQGNMYLSYTGEIIKVCNFIKIENDGYRERLLWEVGRTYAVQPGRGKKSQGRIKITKIRLEKLMDISIHDCISEGIETTYAEEHGYHVPEHRERFFELWDSLYKGTEFEFEKNPDVWVLEFELVEKY